jgi:DNA-binding transcriptional MerR regulator
MLKKYMAGKKLMNVIKRGKVIEQLLWTKKALADDLNVSPPRIDKLIEDGIIPPPTIKVGERLYYTNEQALEIKQVLEQKPLTWTIASLARYLQMGTVVLNWHITKGNVPAPSKNGHFFTDEEAEQIVNFFAEYHQIKQNLWLLGEGLKEIGATPTEYGWLKSHENKLSLPKPVKIGNQRRNKFYTKAQLHQILAIIRMARKERNDKNS